MISLQIDDPRVLAQIDVLHGLSTRVDENLSLLADPDKAWQASDFLPDLTKPDWHEQLAAFRGPARELGDELLVVLVGGMVTEEALPNYAIALNLVARDGTGCSTDPWPRWMRGWTAEENRHGDLLNAYLRLTGRVDMRAIELTIHHLIVGGFSPRAFPDPYAGLIYTAFQERATRISHANTARLAAQQGDATLAKICRRIAGDESRHEQFYTRMMEGVFDQDAESGILIFRDMMRRIIAMPGRLMYDGKDPDLFEHFAVVAQRQGVYTGHDYAQILRHLVDMWSIGTRSVSGKAAAAQEFLCGLGKRLEAVAEQILEKVSKQPRTPFAWIHDRMA